MNRAEGNWSRPLALAIAMALPGSALAVGLGEARVDSYLNQPLEVRMRLLDASADDLDTLTVTPASAAEFDRLGVMSSALALGLEISIDRSESPPVIRVRSNRPVSDPVVQLLIDARWSGGRMLREYTLFLDPPTLPVAPPSAPVRPQAEPARPVPAPMTRQTPEAIRPAAPRTQPQARAISGQSYGPVASGETLWAIARNALPADDITMNQMMVAIVDLNPGAFRDRNINRLLRGAQLQLPTAEQARALSAAAAAAAVAEQNQAFRTGSSGSVPVISDAARVPQPVTPTAAGPASPASSPVDHRLALVPPTDAAGGSGLTGDDAAEVESLRQQLARAEEELFAVRQEAQEFEARLNELESLMRQRQDQGSGLRDAELAALEQTLREARGANAEGADPALRADVSERLDRYLADLGLDRGAAVDGEITDADSDGTGLNGDSGPSAANIGSESTEAVAPAVAEPVADTPRIDSERSWMDRVLGVSMWLLGGVLVLVLAVLAVLGIRRNHSRTGSRTARSGTRPEPRRAAPASPEPETDPIERARDAVRADPASLAMHLALLKTLSASGHELEFGDALENMFEHVESGTEPEWRQALELAEHAVPDHALVKGSADWVADARARDAEPVDALDQEAEVDDLMSRLDADMDETESREWVEPGEDSEPDRDAAVGPLLRSDRDEKPEIRPGSSLAEDDTVDFSDWLSDDKSAPDASQAREPESDKDDLVMDWPDAGEPASRDQINEGDEADEADEAEPEAEFETRQTFSGDGPEPGEALVQDDDQAADGDVFTQGDDDVEVKLDLARAYVSWNSTDSARTLLEEVLREGNDAQREEARQLLDGLGEGEG
ncbi:MAG: hypothetical protein CVV18_05390 [Gammaproteobacteria bacterium HGW-Gammaproteobacteria-8]|nr:MAG: hypothetical protein CVV18_05390 [Gammaproteobacteria bacterium HGW-Gammaproteobacteria-8]